MHPALLALGSAASSFLQSAHHTCRGAGDANAFYSSLKHECVCSYNRYGSLCQHEGRAPAVIREDESLVATSSKKNLLASRRAGNKNQNKITPEEAKQVAMKNAAGGAYNITNIQEVLNARADFEDRGHCPEHCNGIG